MNAKLVEFLRNEIERQGVRYVFVSKKARIEYQRLMRIINQGAMISGSELIKLCIVLNIKQSDLMALVDEVA